MENNRKITFSTAIGERLSEDMSFEPNERMQTRVKTVPDKCDSEYKGPGVRGREKGLVAGRYEKESEGQDTGSERKLCPTDTGP